MVFLFVAQACGSETQRVRGPARAPASEMPEANSMGASRPLEPQSTPAAAPLPNNPGAVNAEVRREQSELDAAQRDLDVASGDCRIACRALGSMDRATGHLCRLTQQGCDEARGKLYSARDRVRTMCGSCPGGASVERSAPVPSVP